MTETETGPELESPGRQGSRISGILGAFLGAMVGYQLWLGLMFALPDGSWLWELIFLGSLLAGFCSCWGYRIFRGRRDMKFAWRAVRICVVLAAPVAIVLFTTGLGLYYADGWWWAGPRVIWIALQSSVENLAGEWKMILALALASLLFAKLSSIFLLKYADPGWYSDPRRAAQSGGGGALYNHPPVWPLPEAEHIPASFEVDKGKITVEGERITVRGSWGKVNSFSVRDVAGVVLGAGSGFNVLYDQEKRILAKFAWSRKNALLFGQYLIRQGVPFVDLADQPVDTRPQNREPLPRQFEVREGKACLWVGIICLAVFGTFSVMCLFVLDELAIWVALAVFLFFDLIGVWMLLSYKNRRMAVEGDTLTYTTAFGRTTQFRVSEVGSLRFRFGLGTREIRNWEGKLLARFEDNMKGAALLVEYLNQHIKQ